MRVPLRSARLHKRSPDNWTQHSRHLEERDPALIDLPVSLPDIPVLSPVITNIVAGKPPASSASPAASSTPKANQNGGSTTKEGGSTAKSSALSTGAAATPSKDTSPALINLPVPLPSIPIISPLLTKIVAGAPEHSSSTSKDGSSSAPAASTPALIDLPIPLPLPSIPVLSPILTKIINGAPEPSSSSSASTSNEGQDSSSALINLPIPLPTIPIISPILTHIVAGAPEPSSGASSSQADSSSALINLPIPLPSIPLLSPILTQIIAGQPEPTKGSTAPGAESSSALINLPIPLPSIPGLSPILTSIIAGKPAPTPSSGNSGKAGSGGSSSGGGAIITLPVPIPTIPGISPILTSIVQGQPAPSPTAGNTGNTGNSGSGNSAGQPSNVGTPAVGTTQVSGNGANPTGIPTGTGAGSVPASQTGSGSGEAVPTGTESVLSGISSFRDGIVTEIGDIRGVVSTDANGVVTTFSNSVLLPGATGTVTINGSAIVTFIPTDGSTAVIPGSTDGTGSNGGNGTNGSGNGDGNTGSASHGLSAAVIGAICAVIALLLLIFLIFFARKWHKKRRAAAQDNYANTGGTGAFAFLGKGNDNMTEKSADKLRRSVRSSFGTTIDHGLRPFTPQPLESSAATLFFTPNVSAIDMGFPVPETPVPEAAAGLERRENDKRGSLISISSDGSAGGERRDSNGSQYLLAPPILPDNVASTGGPQPSPISVRPFSPSESWSFPKPPGSAGTLGSPPPPMSGVPTVTLTDASESHDPFADESECAGPILPPEFERVRRPFMPTLHDELAVSRGDEVRVIETFDDGWMAVEKVPGGESGLIPIDCLREAGEDLPAFLASRRISSHSFEGAIAL
ncbi:hypothetical protein SCHPADRAFT_903014 [Schizopora paradoxa]|uniref:SH3 domain-containing protein n=1 Tax=Schizopora paradoxa TaxID=27342 RepID=A0A0H2SCP6_9AGAM|nr:hypothetical protein SCHPADRAFT_903014 [Schizopora paradoxa]